MGSCSGSCTKLIPSPPPHYFHPCKRVERGGRESCSGRERRHGVKGGVSHYDSAATAGPTSNPLTWGHLPALPAPQIRLRCRSPRLDAGLPTNDFAARACCHEPDADPERNSYRVLGLSPSFGVCARTCSARRRREQLQRAPSANHVWEELL